MLRTGNPLRSGQSRGLGCLLRIPIDLILALTGKRRDSDSREDPHDENNDK